MWGRAIRLHWYRLHDAVSEAPGRTSRVIAPTERLAGRYTISSSAGRLTEAVKILANRRSEEGSVHPWATLLADGALVIGY
jgi:hypothetical protein